MARSTTTLPPVKLTPAEATALLHAAQPDDFPTPTGAVGRAHARRLERAVEKIGTALRVTGRG